MAGSQLSSRSVVGQESKRIAGVMEDGKRRSKAGHGNVQPLCKHAALNNGVQLIAPSVRSAPASGSN